MMNCQVFLPVTEPPNYFAAYMPVKLGLSSEEMNMELGRFGTGCCDSISP
jgi:hypothetical protein